MASSLESLLAEEGFTPTSSKPRRTSATARSVSMPIHPSLPPRAAARTRSDVDRPRSDERRLRAQRSGESSAPVPSLNEAAVKAVVSIIRAHPRRFLKDADFRDSIRRRVVERASEGGSDPKELKRASLQLSMITDLGADKDGSNADVTACAHLYLGVVYGLRRKDRASARHLLQVFNDSPFNARTSLLPELWDRLFRPQFAHLDEWFKAESVEAMPRKARMLEKVYSGALDAGTVRFALYYKGWLADVVVEAPDLPSVAVPSKVLREVASPGILASPMISRRLYEAVFSGLKKSSVDDEREEVSVDLRSRIPEGEGESALLPNELGMHNMGEIQEEVIVDGPPFCVDESVLTPEGSSGMNGMEDPEVQHVKNQSKDVMSWRAPSMCERCVKPNELTLKKLAQEVFHQDSCEDAVMRRSRRMSITLLLRSFQKEGIMNAMCVILAHLQTAPPYARPLVAVLLLHLDQLVERQRHSIYREEAVDAIAVALELSLTDEKVLVTSCRALLMLGGYFSFSGDITTMNWMLNHAGYCDNCRNSPLDIVNDSIQIDEAEGEEEEAKEEWLRHMTVVLLGNGKKSFLEALSKCLGSGNSDLRKACLTTVAWLSHALASVSDAEFQLSAFLALISHLKVSLEDEKQVEHRVLASLSLLNFSKISEIRVPLSNLVEVTWTAKHLQAIIFRERVDLLAKGAFIRHSPLVMRNANISWKTMDTENHPQIKCIK
ncbi:hypothetical protein QJS10_CPB11g02191 [Acorus calamus]|uniref:Uncharacterized protein n=1 Tax=Acorus calamus TaxID=4465 RepID=A0AAV9DSZ7_ACOCL|nr:hypothetical protein QJS10_CPB11g02191 [Acorus calamus]